jgi:hypothetical protein
MTSTFLHKVYLMACRILNFTLGFIRFKILYISSTYIRCEKKIWAVKEVSPFQNLVGMVDIPIREYCFEFGKNGYSGQGALIDLGSWLGSSIIPLIKGLNKNLCIDKSFAKVHAYDAFVWYENMNQSAHTSIPPYLHSYKVGDDFSAGFIEQLGNLNTQVHIHKGNLEDAFWNKQPIEYLFIDAMKDWEVAVHVVYTFFPFLIPGKGIIIHEDFCHHYTSWIHLIQFRLKDYFQPIENLQNSTGVGFKLVKPLPDLTKIIPQFFNDFSDKEIELAFQYSLSLVAKRQKPSVYAAKIMAFRHKGNYRMASKLFSKANFCSKIVNSEMNEVANVLKREYKKPTLLFD